MTHFGFGLALSCFPMICNPAANQKGARGGGGMVPGLYRPPFTCGQCNRAVYLWCIFCDGCIHCLVGVECLARRFKDRDEVKWVLQKWEKEVHV